MRCIGGVARRLWLKCAPLGPIRAPMPLGGVPNAHFASVYAKPDGRPLVDTFITEVSQDTWILFPWDSELKPSPTVLELQSGD